MPWRNALQCRGHVRRIARHISESGLVEVTTPRRPGWPSSPWSRRSGVCCHPMDLLRDFCHRRIWPTSFSSVRGSGLRLLRVRRPPQGHRTSASRCETFKLKPVEFLFPSNSILIYFLGERDAGTMGENRRSWKRNKILGSHTRWAITLHLRFRF